MEFSERYGPWAVIAGASEGTGRAFARQIASRGVGCILVARREEPLQSLAEEIRAAGGADCIVAPVDLAAPNAGAQMIEAAGGREVGLFVANAGADTNGARFLDREMDAWSKLIRLNVLSIAECCHAFGQPMKTRGRGGLLLVNSGACYGGGTFMATYSGAKAFELCFAEGLWAELRPYGVDVLSLVLGKTDTPAFRALLAEKGLPVPADLASPDAVAEAGLAQLAQGPIHNYGLANDAPGWGYVSADDRRTRVERVSAGSKAVFGD
jgi:short-subunit dehydrogenase